MKVRCSFCILSFFTLVITGYAQSTFVPKNLGTEINSAYDEVSPVLSPDRATLYFTRLNHPDNKEGIKNTADIWSAQLKKDGSVASVFHITSLNRGKYNSVLSVSADGNQLLIYSDKNLYTVIREGQTWGQPLKLDVKASKDASMSNDGNHIVFSKGGNIYITEKTQAGSWGKPIALKTLNESKESTPFLLADNKTLYFTSDRRGKQLDVFKTTREGTGWDIWSKPLPLNDTINSVQNEEYLKTTVNGSWAYFSSAANSHGKADIFRVKLYEENPFIEITGTVVNAITKRPLKNLPITLLADGKPVDSVKINKDSATFRAKLPLKKNYSLTAHVDHYTEYPITVNAKDVNEYTRLHANLEEGPTKYVVLKGKLLIKNTGLPIPGKATPTIVVDGDVIDSAKVDLTNSEYSVKLNHGAVYYVQVSAKQFESFPALVDFTSMDGYEEITLDLHADAEKMAIVTGQLIDQKTGTPLVYPATPTIEVEGVSSVTASVDSLTGNYELRLPLKLAYLVSVKVPGYYPISESIDVTKETSEVTKTLSLTAVPVEKGKSVVLKNVTFDNKGALVGEALPELDKLAAFLTSNPRVKIQVEGYTSRTNKVSTLNMARAAVKYLTTKGVPPTQLFAKGMGTGKAAQAKKENLQPVRIEFTFLAVN